MRCERTAVILTWPEHPENEAVTSEAVIAMSQSGAATKWFLAPPNAKTFSTKLVVSWKEHLRIHSYSLVKIPATLRDNFSYFGSSNKGHSFDIRMVADSFVWNKSKGLITIQSEIEWLCCGNLLRQGRFRSEFEGNRLVIQLPWKSVLRATLWLAPSRMASEWRQLPVPRAIGIVQKGTMIGKLNGTIALILRTISLVFALLAYYHSKQESHTDWGDDTKWVLFVLAMNSSAHFQNLSCFIIQTMRGIK